MRTKALVLTATFVIAGVVNSMAQVYSANAVGYVNMQLADGLSLIANPLINGDNNIDTVMPLPDTASGTTIYRFDAATGNYGDSITFVGFGLGWNTASADPNWKIMNPGEGFFVQVLSGTGPLDVTFVGDVPQGNLSNTLPAPGNLLIKSSQVPQEAALGKGLDADGPAEGLEFPAVTGDTIFIWNPTIQNYNNSWTYLSLGAGGAPGTFGWVSDTGVWPTPGPVIPVGAGFFVQRGPGGGTSWNRTFSVNNP
jgi:hypothetical protein